MINSHLYDSSMCHTLSKSIFRSKNHKLVYGTDFVIPENKIEFETG